MTITKEAKNLLLKEAFGVPVKTNLNKAAVEVLKVQLSQYESIRFCL